tara:strand:+ start:1286 stop:2101 length:816 start_codon:yes stop_codon:yes gene_type:complete
MHSELLNFFTLLLITGIFSGILAGLLGVGGGIIIVPVTYYILKSYGVPSEVIMHISVASSLGVIILTSISSIFSHYKLKNIEIEIVKKWFFGTIIGSIFGAFLASRITGDSLVLIFITLASIISFKMIIGNNFVYSKKIPSNNLFNSFISFIISTFSVSIGIGGGSFTVPTLTAFGKNIHKAVGTSATIGLLISFPGFLIYVITGYNIEGIPNYSLGYANLIIILCIAITSIFTAPIGAKLSIKFNNKALKKIFAVFLLMTCISLFINHFF